MAEGLMFVLSQPRPGEEQEFHSWYDDEHAPARLTVPGIRTAERYAATDDARPDWLALYETDLDALATPAYRKLSTDRSEREARVMGRLETLDRRVYELIDDQGSAAAPSPVVVSVALSTSRPDELGQWYRQEHVPLLHRMPGWRRTRRYRRTEGDGPDFLAFHEIDGVELFDEPEYREATSTEWRSTVMSAVTARERRVFGYHNTARVS